MRNAVKVGPATDARNKRVVEFASRTFLGYGLHHNPEMLLDGDDDVGRAYYAQRVYVRLKLLAIIVTAVVLMCVYMPRPQKPAPVPPAFQDAGTVVSLQFHDTTFSRSTSVTTSQGTFQVAGAVTASAGDEARIKKTVEIGRFDVTSLCIDSHFKPECYPVL